LKIQKLLRNQMLSTRLRHPHQVTTSVCYPRTRNELELLHVLESTDRQKSFKRLLNKLRNDELSWHSEHASGEPRGNETRVLKRRRDEESRRWNEFTSIEPSKEKTDKKAQKTFRLGEQRLLTVCESGEQSKEQVQTLALYPHNYRRRNHLMAVRG
jgi:hypothetical protein